MRNSTIRDSVEIVCCSAYVCAFPDRKLLRSVDLLPKRIHSSKTSKMNSSTLKPLALLFHILLVASFNEILGERFRIAEALDRTIHIACVAHVVYTGHSFTTRRIFTFTRFRVTTTDLEARYFLRPTHISIT